MATPSVTIVLDKPYEIRFSMRMMKRFEQLTGKKIMALDANMSIDTVVQVLWVMLLNSAPVLTEEETYDLIDECAENVQYVINKVVEAIRVSFPELNKSEGSDLPNAQAPDANT